MHYDGKSQRKLDRDSYPRGKGSLKRKKVCQKTKAEHRWIKDLKRGELNADGHLGSMKYVAYTCGDCRALDWRKEEVIA